MPPHRLRQTHPSVRSGPVGLGTPTSAPCLSTKYPRQPGRGHSSRNVAPCFVLAIVTAPNITRLLGETSGALKWCHVYPLSLLLLLCSWQFQSRELKIKYLEKVSTDWTALYFGMYPPSKCTKCLACVFFCLFFSTVVGHQSSPVFNISLQLSQPLFTGLALPAFVVLDAWCQFSVKISTKLSRGQNYQLEIIGFSKVAPRGNL